MVTLDCMSVYARQELTVTTTTNNKQTKQIWGNEKNQKTTVYKMTNTHGKDIAQQHTTATTTCVQVRKIGAAKSKSELLNIYYHDTTTGYTGRTIIHIMVRSVTKQGEYTIQTM
jgi:hypothetical protein